MSFAGFLILYGFLTLALVAKRWRYFGQHWGPLLRCSICAATLAFFIDYPAEDRQLWSFSAPSRMLLLSVPIENMIFISLSAIWAIAIYQLCEIIFGRTMPRHQESEDEECPHQRCHH